MRLLSGGFLALAALNAIGFAVAFVPQVAKATTIPTVPDLKLVIGPTPGEKLGAEFTSNGRVAVYTVSSLDGKQRSARIVDLRTGNSLGVLSPKRPDDASTFGTAIAMHGNHVVITSRAVNENGGFGAADVFNVLDGRHVARLAPASTSSSDYAVGRTVAINSHQIVIGRSRPTSDLLLKDFRSGQEWIAALPGYATLNDLAMNEEYLVVNEYNKQVLIYDSTAVSLLRSISFESLFFGPNDRIDIDGDVLIVPFGNYAASYRLSTGRKIVGYTGPFDAYGNSEDVAISQQWALFSVPGAPFSGSRLTTFFCDSKTGQCVTRIGDGYSGDVGTRLSLRGNFALVGASYGILVYQVSVPEPKSIGISLFAMSACIALRFRRMIDCFRR